jgi:hypothetical protein
LTRDRATGYLAVGEACLVGSEAEPSGRERSKHSALRCEQIAHMTVVME